MDTLWQDLRFASRVLTGDRQFTAVAVLVLALGIGTTTTVFSVINAVLLRPLPYQDPAQLVAVSSIYKSSAAPRTRPVIALTDMAEWRGRSQLIASMGAFAYTQLPVRVANRSFSPVTALMDPAFLPTLGNPIAMGTFFDPVPEGGSDRSAILSHALWRDAFGADVTAIGRTITVDGQPYVVRGVLPADFQFPRSDASYYTKPVGLLLPSSSFKGFPAASRQWFGIGRLKPGVALEEAQAELQSVAEGLAPGTPAGAKWSVQLTPLDQATTRGSRQPLLIVLGISVVLLLIAATNLMNLFFSRGVARLREMSIRRAIGCSTGRLVRQLLTEGLVLAIAGGAIGLMFASLAINALVAISPVHLPVTASIDIDGMVFAFTAAICVAAGLAASFFPALHVSAKTNEAVRSPGMRASASRRVARVQQGLCVAQIALGMALLASAGLLARSLWTLTAVDPGFESKRVIGFDLSVPNDHSLEDRVRFYAGAPAGRCRRHGRAPEEGEDQNPLKRGADNIVGRYTC